MQTSKVIPMIVPIAAPEGVEDEKLIESQRQVSWPFRYVQTWEEEEPQQIGEFPELKPQHWPGEFWNAMVQFGE